MKEWGFVFPEVIASRTVCYVYPDVTYDIVSEEVENQVLKNGSATLLPTVDFYHMLMIGFSRDKDFLLQTRISKQLAGNVRAGKECKPE